MEQLECKVPWCTKAATSKIGWCIRHREQIRVWGEIRRTRFDPNEIIVKESVAYIKLYDSKGKERKEFCIIDADDVPKINKHKWHYNFGYCSSDSASRRIQEVILGVKTNHRMVIDHINGNGLDNRKSNLRYCEQKFNILNRKIGGNNKSGHKGVWYNKNRDRWEAYIKVNETRFHFGYFKLKEDAVRARIEGEIKYHKDFRYGKGYEKGVTG